MLKQGSGNVNTQLIKRLNKHRGLLKSNFFINVEFKLSKSSNASEGDHAFSVYTKSFKKLTFSYSLIRTRIGSVSFLDDFAYLLNE